MILGAICFASMVFALCSLSGRAEAVVCEAEPTDMSVTYSERITCEINSATDTDLYRFSGETDDRILAEAVWISGANFKPRIKLIAPDGTELADTWNPAARVNIVLPQTGIYTAIISDNQARYIGEYAFTVSCIGGSCQPSPPPTEPAGKNIQCGPEPTDMFPQYGTRVTCEINSYTDTDLYRFSGETDDRILAEAVWISGANFKPRIKLIAPDGTELADTWNPAARVNIVLPQTGIYTAIISDNQARYIGEYAFTVSCIGGSCLTTVSSCGVKGDVNDDGKIGLEDAIYILQVVSGPR